jgi:putative ABC transport system permease protein
MNLFQLVLKQMRQRALSTWLTLLSVVIGVALAIAILILQRESDHLFGQSDFGYDIIVGPPKGSPLQLTLNTVYHLDKSEGNIPYALYEDMSHKGKPLPGHSDYGQYVRHAIPFMVGDSYKGHRLVGTSPQMFGFDDDAKPFAGYDAMGRRLRDYQDPNVPEELRDKDKPVAASTFEYRREHKYELAQGTGFHARRFEAIIGSEIAEKEAMKLGDVFQATHGFPGPGEIPDIHKPKWTVVGILKPTHTANDRVLFIPLISLYAIEEHDIGLWEQLMLKNNFNWRASTPAQTREFFKTHGTDPETLETGTKRHFKIDLPTTKPASPGQELMKDATPAAAPTTAPEEEPDAYTLNANGDIVPELPQSAWQISAILVKTRAPYLHEALMYQFQVVNQEATAVNPASVMRDFFDTFLASSTEVLLIISRLVMVVAGVSILVSIYNSVSARMREIAIMRALGATRLRILTLICAEAALVGLFGSLLGLLFGHLTGAIESFYFNQRIGQSIEWYHVSTTEFYSVLLAVGIAALAGLVPAVKAYSSPVAVNLTNG